MSSNVPSSNMSATLAEQREALELKKKQLQAKIELEKKKLELEQKKQQLLLIKSNSANTSGSSTSSLSTSSLSRPPPVSLATSPQTPQINDTNSQTISTRTNTPLPTTPLPPRVDTLSISSPAPVASTPSIVSTTTLAETPNNIPHQISQPSSKRPHPDRSSYQPSSNGPKYPPSHHHHHHYSSSSPHPSSSSPYYHHPTGQNGHHYDRNGYKSHYHHSSSLPPLHGTPRDATYSSSSSSLSSSSSSVQQIPIDPSQRSKKICLQWPNCQYNDLCCRFNHPINIITTTHQYICHDDIQYGANRGLLRLSPSILQHQVYNLVYIASQLNVYQQQQQQQLQHSSSYSSSRLLPPHNHKDKLNKDDHHVNTSTRINDILASHPNICPYDNPLLLSSQHYQPTTTRSEHLVDHNNNNNNENDIDPIAPNSLLVPFIQHLKTYQAFSTITMSDLLYTLGFPSLDSIIKAIKTFSTQCNIDPQQLSSSSSSAIPSSSSSSSWQDRFVSSQQTTNQFSFIDSKTIQDIPIQDASSGKSSSDSNQTTISSTSVGVRAIKNTKYTISLSLKYGHQTSPTSSLSPLFYINSPSAFVSQYNISFQLRINQSCTFVNLAVLGTDNTTGYISTLPYLLESLQDTTTSSSSSSSQAPSSTVVAKTPKKLPSIPPILHNITKLPVLYPITESSSTNDDDSSHSSTSIRSTSGQSPNKENPSFRLYPVNFLCTGVLTTHTQENSFDDTTYDFSMDISSLSQNTLRSLRRVKVPSTLSDNHTSAMSRDGHVLLYLPKRDNNIFYTDIMDITDPNHAVKTSLSYAKNKTLFNDNNAEEQQQQRLKDEMESRIRSKREENRYFMSSTQSKPSNYFTPYELETQHLLDNIHHSSSSIGLSLLESFGWNRSSGLGTEQQGILEPLQICVRPERFGLGYPY